MSADASWQEINNNLAQLLGDNTYAPFHLFLQKLQQWSSAGVYSSSIFVALIEIIRRMQEEVAAGHPILDVIDLAMSGTFVQPDWDVHGSVFQFILGDFRKEIESENPIPDIAVPIILLVMTAAEAEALRQGTVLRGSPDEILADFADLQSHLSGNGAADWIGRYRATSQEWQPFSSTDGAETIEQLISRTLSRITGYESRFVPEFIDIRTLNEESNRPVLKELRQEGCVVVIDIISMRHPTINRDFYQSALDAHPNTSVVSIAPINSAFDILREMSLIIQLRISDMEFAKRKMDDNEEYGICEELCEGRQFSHWLTDRVKKLPVTKAIPKKGILSYMYKLENKK